MFVVCAQRACLRWNWCKEQIWDEKTQDKRKCFHFVVIVVDGASAVRNSASQITREYIINLIGFFII